MKKNRSTTQHKTNLGKDGEKLAKEFAQKNGYAVLEMNWRWGKLEIDMICKKNNVLHFIEVKTRQSATFGHPEDFVDEQKMKRLFQIANQYMYLCKHQNEYCFDIISVTIKPNLTIRMIEDAFFPTW